LIKLRRGNTTPTTPTSIVKDLDPIIERVIDRCIQRDPALRPSSALQVAAALPGGDPIAAALAAGETPSPEMVAAAPKEGALRPAVAVSMFALIVVGLAVIVLLADKVVLYGYVPLDKSPDVLRENARDIIRRVGVVAPVTDDTHAFEQDRGPLDYIAETDTRAQRWQGLKDGQPAVVVYWYRQSPGYLGGFDLFRDGWTNPPPIVSGMAGVKLDTRGRLLEFYTVPPQVDPVPSSEFRVSRSEQASSSKSQVSSSKLAELETRNSKLPPLLTGHRCSLRRDWISLTSNQLHPNGRRFISTTLARPGTVCTPNNRKFRFVSRPPPIEANPYISRLLTHGTNLSDRNRQGYRVSSKLCSP